MFPSFAVNDTTNSRIRNIELFGKKDFSPFGWSVSLSYFDHIEISEFSRAKYSPPFLVHVLGIVRVGTKKQVVRPDTVSHIASMANEQTFRNGTKVKFPGIAVRNNTLAFIAVVEGSVPAVVQADSPKPASIGLINVTPKPSVKSLFLKSTVELTGAEATAKSAITTFNIKRAGSKKFTAIFTRLLNFSLGSGIMRLHRNSPFYVTPPAATNSAGVLCCLNLGLL
jgi:hypothetical protein